METMYRVFRYRADDPQHGAPGTGVTIKDGLQNANWVGAFRDGYLEALLGAGWDYYDQLAATNPAGEHWIFTFESYPVEQCCQCGAYVPAWWIDKDQQPWCVGCLGEAKLDKGEVDFVRGIWQRMVRAQDEHGPYIGNWPTDWETRDLNEQQSAAVPVCVEVVGTITLERDITTDDLCDVLCTAFDGACGGCNYWVDSLRVGARAIHGEPNYKWEHAAYDGALVIRTMDEPTDKVGHVLTKANLLQGIERAAREGRFQLREGWPGDVDAEVADVIVQYGLFGEIVYG